METVPVRRSARLIVLVVELTELFLFLLFNGPHNLFYNPPKALHLPFQRNLTCFDVAHAGYSERFEKSNCLASKALLKNPIS
jgi:hypothetical protein